MQDAALAPGLWTQLWRRKSLDNVPQHNLHRTLTTSGLVSLGVGSVVGAGIFVITGQAASKYAGPALSVSFIISSVACFLTGLCYAELAACIPLVGSAYSYAYVSLGEGCAWVVALCLTLEYLVSASAVAVGWGASVQAILAEGNVTLPTLVSAAPFAVTEGQLTLSGSVINLPATVIIIVLTAVICRGVRESANFNHFTVITKLTVLIVFVLYGIQWAATHRAEFDANMTPFLPRNEGQFGKFGVSGVFRGAGAIFFAYLGFDTVCAMAMETKNPARDVPRGLFLTLVICTTFYVLVTLCLTGMVNYTRLNVDAPVIEAVMAVHAPRALRLFVEVGSIAGLTSVCLCCLLSMPRIILAAASDSLLPERLGFVHPTYRTPFTASLGTGAVAAVTAAVFPLEFLGKLVSFGTLIAFATVCAGVIHLRKLNPNLHRPFRTPYAPYLPALGIGCCVLQMFCLPAMTVVNFSVFLSLGAGYYYFFGRFGSKFYEPPPQSPRVEVSVGIPSEPQSATNTEIDLARAPAAVPTAGAASPDVPKSTTNLMPDDLDSQKPETQSTFDGDAETGAVNDPDDAPAAPADVAQTTTPLISGDDTKTAPPDTQNKREWEVVGAANDPEVSPTAAADVKSRTPLIADNMALAPEVRGECERDSGAVSDIDTSPLDASPVVDME